MAKKKKNEGQPEEPENKVVVATSNMKLLNEVFVQAGLPPFEEQFAKAVQDLVKQYEKQVVSSPTTEEGQDG